MDSLGHRTDFGKTCVVKARLAVVCLTVCWTTAWAVPAAAQVAPLSARSVAVDLSSGPIDNPGAAAVAFSVDVDLGPEALWVRVLFAEADLPGASAVRVTSLSDGVSQTLDAERLAEWRSATGFFNGSAVRIELLAGAGTTGNLVRVERFVIGLPPVPDFSPLKSVCGTADLRTPSFDAAVGRLPGSGCTGFLVDCPDGGTCLLSAGHCFAGDLSTVIEFDVPESGDDCAPRHPPMDEQFAVDPSSVIAVDRGPGDDWALFRTFANPETGLTAFEEQGVSYPVAETTPASGTVRVTGFGVDAHGDASGGGITACGLCAPEVGEGFRNLTQQTHSGAIVQRTATTLTYRADTCAGSSGSPVVFTSTGRVVAVHTHTGCAVSANLGTAVTRARLLEALASRGRLALVKDGALDLGGDGVANAGDAVDYTFRITNTGGATVTGVLVDDPLAAPISCPGGHPIASLQAGATVTCTGSAVVTEADVAAEVKHNTATVTATDPTGALVHAEDGHSEPIPPSSSGPVPFSCTGEAYIVQNESAQLTLVDQTVDPFEFIPIGMPAGTEINNLGFRSSDGFLYGVELLPNANAGIVRIDHNGNVFNLGHPPAFPTAPRFDAGDVTPDGTAMYITATSRPLYRLDLTQLPSFPPVTHVAIRGAGGSVSDWAVSPIDGKLYGGDGAQGQLAVVEPATGDRVDFNVPGLPAGSPFGGAWFDASGRLFLYQNSGAIYEIDVVAHQIVDIQTGPGSSRNDGAACVVPPKSLRR